MPHCQHGVSQKAASASCSLPCCRLALFYALRAAMAPRRHARAAPQKGLILLTNHAEARVKRERVGHPLSDVVEHLLHPSFGRDADFGLGCRPSRPFALWLRSRFPEHLASA
jgi:hypothetical protein